MGYVTRPAGPLSLGRMSAISPQKAAAVREFYEKLKKNPFVVARKIRNLEGGRTPVTEALSWEVMVSCLLTSRQKSGPQSPINRFMLTKPFPLNLAATRAQKNVGDWIVATLEKHKGIRFKNNIARYSGSNFVKLENGWWPEFMSTLRTLDRPHEKMDERRAAHIIDYSLKGFGPKQARNLLQCLGLTQHETPLDSRVVQWLKGFGLPAPDSDAALGKADSYDAAMDSFQQIAMAADIPPCLLDAAIFASFDQGWSIDEMAHPPAMRTLSTPTP